MKIQKPTSKNAEATPFVKWVGGKRGVIKELISRVPETFKDYYEPFIGGGALFFVLNGRLKKAYLSDMNTDLVLSYSVIKKEPEKLLEQLRKHKKNHNEEYYYKTRALINLEDPILIASRMIYLNKTCYNGLYRTNKKGIFNVPIGNYKNPNIVGEENIWECNRVLKKAKISYQDFTKINPKKDDFVYLDPPYHPTDDLSFTKYTQGDFTEKDQVRLRDFVFELNKKGVKVMISNSNTDFIKGIYKHKDFNIHFINAPRLINCKSDKRKPIKEVLITNY